MVKGMGLVRVGSKKLSVLNTTDDIAHILLKEVTGDEFTGKNAIYNIASMFLQQQDDLPEVKPVLDDLVEYLLIIGNAAHKTTTDDIMQYLNIRNEINEKKSDYVNNPNPRFRKLLQHVILGSSAPEDGRVSADEIKYRSSQTFMQIIDELNSFYRAILERASLPGGLGAHEDKAEVFIPPEVNKAASILLVNFPILQRLELRDYNDIVAGIEIDNLLSSVSDDYASQVTGYIEGRIDQLVREKTGDGTEANLRKCTAQEILLQTKLGYVISRGIVPSVPNFSIKHFDDSDYKLAMLSAVSRMRREDREFSSRQDEMNMNFWAYHSNYNNRSAHIMYEHRMRQRHSEKGYDSTDEFRRQIREMIGYSPSEFSGIRRITAVKMLSHASDGIKIATDNWEKFFSMYKEEIGSIDELGFLILAYTSGIKPHYSIRFLDDNRDISYEKRKKEEVFGGIILTNFESKSPIERQLRKVKISRDYDEDGYSEEDFNPYLEAHEILVPGSDFNRFLYSLAAVYVNNKIIGQLRDIDDYPLEHFLTWNSPLNFVSSYSPEEAMIADYLMKQYPVFSRIPVLSPEDIANGIILTSLQTATGDDNLDTGATITQNLAVRQLHSMNKLVEDTKNENYQS